MKYSLLFGLLIACLGTQCQGVKPTAASTDSVSRIEFTTLTRGYQKQVTMTRDSIFFHEEGRDAKGGKGGHAMTREKWEMLMGCLKNIPLREIPDLKSPTAKRAYDGARHSTITITSGDGQSYAHGFDNEDPHEKLQPLMRAILALDSDR